jgi:hypothetical protein
MEWFLKDVWWDVSCRKLCSVLTIDSSGVPLGSPDQKHPVQLVVAVELWDSVPVPQKWDGTGIGVIVGSRHPVVLGIDSWKD